MIEAYLITLLGVMAAQASPGSNLTAEQVLAFRPIGAISGFLIYGSYSLLFSTGLAERTYSRFARWFELAFGAAFGVLGGKLFLDGVRELRT